MKKWDNEVTRCILCCMKCFFWCLERFLRFLSKNAYIMCAIHGKPFCTSARDAFNLLMRNFLRAVALDKVTEFLLFLTKIMVTVGMGALTYVYFTSEKFEDELNYIQVPVVIVMFGTYLIASVFFGVYSMAVDTLFLCFCKYYLLMFHAFTTSNWLIWIFSRLFSGRLRAKWWFRREALLYVKAADENPRQKE